MKANKINLIYRFERVFANFLYNVNKFVDWGVYLLVHFKIGAQQSRKNKKLYSWWNVK